MSVKVVNLELPRVVAEFTIGIDLCCSRESIPLPLSPLGAAKTGAVTPVISNLLLTICTELLLESAAQPNYMRPAILFLYLPLFGDQLLGSRLGWSLRDG